MSNETNYNEMTVPELRELADKRGIDVPHDANKAEIISALKKGDKGAKPHGKDKSKAKEPVALKKVEFEDMSHADLKQLAAQHNVDASDASKADIIAALNEAKVEPPLRRDEDDVNQRGAKEVEESINAYEDFEDPVTDGSKPIIDQTTPSNVVIALVFDGSPVLTIPPVEGQEDQDHLIFV